MFSYFDGSKTVIETMFDEVITTAQPTMGGELVSPMELDLQELEPLEAPGWRSWAGWGVGFTIATVVSYIGVTAT